MKRLFKRAGRKILRWLEEEDPEDVQDSDPAWRHLNLQVDQVAAGGLRRSYAWAVLNAASLARALGQERISVIEFGVAAGRGLVSLDQIAARVQALTRIDIDVYGFDTGKGLPKPEDYRDDPHHWSEGMFFMDVEGLKRQLKQTELILGPVRETVATFLERETVAPIGFVAFDLDFYSSTVDALPVLELPYERLLPRVYCLFDDILGYTYNDFTGERLAISEFNEAHKTRKISPIYGLRFYVPRQDRNQNWVDKLFIAHTFEHPLYGKNDSLGAEAAIQSP